MKPNARYLPVLLFSLAAAQGARADGVSAYLPLNLEPEMERQIERVLILANEPILKRPFPVALVELALPEACEHDRALCERVRRYLERYHKDYALTHASVTGSITHGANDLLPNQHGMRDDSHYAVSAIGFVQPTDYFLASAGAISYQGRTVPTGSMLSVGTNWAQLDIGYRDHWLSPLTETSALVSTEAPTTPSVTISNYEPLTRLGIQYEFFLTKLSEQPILYLGNEQLGSPRLFGMQLSIEPFSGWSLGVNRTLEYGGGAGLPTSPRFLVRDFFKPSGLSQNQGNQQASYISRFIVPTKTPFAVYFQYAGEDNSAGGSYLLGSPQTSAGIDFPKIGKYFDLTYEISEWSNIWYIHGIFLNGMTQDGAVLGAWGADQRNFNDGTGARSQMLRLGWTPPFGGYLEQRVRTVANQIYYGSYSRRYVADPPAYPYQHYFDYTLRYSRPWNGLTVGGEALAGRDVYGKNFTRLSAFVRYGGEVHTREVALDEDIEDNGTYTPKPYGVELFVDAGANANRLRVDVGKEVPIETSKVNFGPHFAFGARKAVSLHSDFGARVELDQVDGHTLLGLRPLDYRYRFNGPLALSLFAGVARYNLETPATSMYAGLGAAWRNLLPGWDLDMDFRYAQNLARDHVLAADFQGIRPESFYKIESLTLYLSRHF